MRNAAALARANADVANNGLYERIGAFLARHGLSPEPAHYQFAYQVIACPESALAGVVRELTEGGVRLAGRDIERLGGTAGAQTTPTRPPVSPPSSPRDHVDSVNERLEARIGEQVASLETVVRAIRDETSDFGRDLAASARSIGDLSDAVTGPSAITDIVEITGAMIERVHVAEEQLVAATAEASELRSMLAEARATARRDPLTGLANRRAFAEAFATDLAATRCLAMVDIDWFKRVNDAFGHAVGDRVLGAVGNTLTEACHGQMVARHGGEEFAVLLCGHDLAAAWQIIDRARAELAARKFRTRDTGQGLGSITISAGVTAIRSGEPLDGALARADRLLYAAKTSGRNVVITD